MANRGVIEISRKIIHNGIEVKVDKKNYQITYPSPIWLEFPEVYRQTFADTLTYFFTKHLSMIDHHKLVYRFPPPVTEPYYFRGMAYSFGETAMLEGDGVTVSGLFKKLYNSQFQTKFTGRPRYALFKNVNRNSWTRSLIPFSFGKDSLLTFALSKELGINPYPVFFREPKSPFENRHKKILAGKFNEEFGIEIDFFPVSTGKLRQVTGFYWGWDLLLTQYTLLLIPYLFGTRTKYLFWAHEQSCNDTFTDREGYVVNPVFEQSHNWLLLSNSVAKVLGCNAIFASLIEPIHELSVMKILHYRYPKIAKYQTSCFEDEKEARNKRWCGVCSKCARMYIFMLALSILPKRVGFMENMLKKSKKNLFAVFSKTGVQDSAYNQSKTAREEQLLAFTLAYKNGIRGGIMQDFAKSILKEGLKKERKLRLKYFGIHSMESLTYELKKPLLKIFNEELEMFRERL